MSYDYFEDTKMVSQKVITLVLLAIVLVIAFFVSSLVKNYININQEKNIYTHTTTTPQISDQQKVSIMTKPSGIPITNSTMTDAERIKIMTSKK